MRLPVRHRLEIDRSEYLRGPVAGALPQRGRVGMLGRLRTAGAQLDVAERHRLAGPDPGRTPRQLYSKHSTPSAIHSTSPPVRDPQATSTLSVPVAVSAEAAISKERFRTSGHLNRSWCGMPA